MERFKSGREERAQLLIRRFPGRPNAKPKCSDADGWGAFPRISG